MELKYSPKSPSVRKVPVVAHALGIMDREAFAVRPTMLAPAPKT